MQRDPACGEKENPLSRGPSGLLRSSKSGRQQHTSATPILLALATPKAKRTAAVGNLQLTTIAAE